MIEDWIDDLCDVWRTVSAPGFQTMRSPYLIKRKEFPSAISPKDNFPIALTIPASLDPSYSVGGPKVAFYSGVTQFHLVPDLSMGHIPAMLPYYGSILRAAAANVLLGGKVADFMVNPSNGIIGPLAMQYGDEAEHWGFMVNWTVKEIITLTVGDPSVTA